MATRIVEHRLVRAADIDRHELNPRTHTDAQRAAYRAIIKEVGFARSLLAYTQPNGRLKLIDGHLRHSELHPDELVEVEILDVNDAEARKLLLTIDPLAQLASYDAARVDDLRGLVTTNDVNLDALWRGLHEATPIPMPGPAEDFDKIAEPSEREYMIIITCPNEKTQREILEKCHNYTWAAKAVTS